MDHDRFIALVQDAAGTDREHAERATRATLQTLGERLYVGQARDLAMQLPPELAPYIGHVGDPERFAVDEFLRRVAEREDADLGTAERDARAVFTALGQAISRDEMDQLVNELPSDFARLLPRGRWIEGPGAGEFVRAVAERAGLDADAARRATYAVLETLGERIAGGEVEDLVDRLPAELHAPLKVGDGLSNGAARRMSLEEFLRRVAEREGVTPVEAAKHTRAVFATLREVIDDDEFLDVTVQLPGEYAAVLAKP
jgi:uncharacterized protein (DUF2267 family)